MEKTLFVVVVLVLAAVSVHAATAGRAGKAAGAPQGSVSIKAVGGVYSLFNREVPAEGKKIEPVPLEVAGSGAVTLAAIDIFGQPTGWKKDLNLTGQAQKVDFDGGIGFFTIQAKIADKVEGSCEVGVLPPWHKGVRKDSFFGSNTSNVRQGQELLFLQAIGMKVQRTHFHGTSVQAVKNLADHDTWVLPIVGYAIGAKSDWATQYNMHGPPKDYKPPRYSVWVA